MLPAVTATRYVTPLREGGSLPGLMEADDLGTYVVKWRAAGQGVKVLVAEVVCGELARALGLPVPALVTVDVAPELAVGEPVARTRRPTPRCIRQSNTAATARSKSAVPCPTTPDRSPCTYPAGSTPSLVAPTSG